MPDRLELQEGLDLPRALHIRTGAHDALHVLGSELLELGNRTVRTREIDRVDVHVTGEPGCQLIAEAGEDIDGTGGEVRGRERLRELDRRQRVQLGGDRDDCVPADERRWYPRDDSGERGL